MLAIRGAVATAEKRLKCGPISPCGTGAPERAKATSSTTEGAEEHRGRYTPSTTKVTKNAK